MTTDLRNTVEFDYSRLRGRIVEKYRNLRNFAEIANFPLACISSRLNNRTVFRPAEIYHLSRPELLDIPDEEIVAYFFKPKVQ